MARLLAAVLLGALSTSALAQDHVVVSPASLEPVLDLPPEVAEALRDARWEDALPWLRDAGASLPAPQRADLAFVHAWAAVRAEQAAPLVARLDEVRAAPSAPRSWKALAIAEILREAGDGVAALAALDDVEPGSAVAPRAEAVRAGILHELGRTREASEVWRRMIDVEDPTPGVAHALGELARARGLDSPEGLALQRRLWANYPHTDEGREATARLGPHHAEAPPTLEEVVARAMAHLRAGAWRDAIDVTAGHEDVQPDGLLGCTFHYARGRALYKDNQLGAAIEAMGDAGSRCASGEEGHGEKILYLQGYAHFRRGEFVESARAYRAIAEHHPESSYADDGLTRAGIAWVEAGDLDRAMALWGEALERYPAGDTVPEATFRVAFTHFERGDTPGAIAVAERLAALPAEADEVHVPAGAYWAARWRAWPSWDEPRRRTADADALREAADGLAAVATTWSHHWYGALAHARLTSLDPERAAALSRSPVPPWEGWQVRPAVRAEADAAVRLLRLGLVRDGRAAWPHALDGLEPEEVAWYVDLRYRAGDLVDAHGLLHDWLRTHPAPTLGPRGEHVLRLALPDAYGDIVREVATAEGLPPRFLHALVREESGFDRAIRSFAGARGLAQLMPGTADTVARWLDLSPRALDLTDPRTNVRLGGRYLAWVRKGDGDDPALALAGYNAGPGRVDDWLEAHGNLPLDAFVERIPYRETRGYVKRVTGTWQAYTWLDAEGPAWIDLTPWIDAVRPDLRP